MAKAVVILASSAAKRTSEKRAVTSPSPAHAPLMAQMTGLGTRAVMVMGRRPVWSMDWPGRDTRSRSWASRPGQKARPAPVSTTALTSSSSLACSRRSWRANSISRFQALLRSGRLRVRVSTPASSTSWRTVVESTPFIGT